VASIITDGLEAMERVEGEPSQAATTDDELERLIFIRANRGAYVPSMPDALKSQSSLPTSSVSDDLLLISLSILNRPASSSASRTSAGPSKNLDRLDMIRHRFIPWTYHNSTGVMIHQQDCHRCDDFVAHLRAASESGDPLFAKALEELCKTQARSTFQHPLVTAESTRQFEMGYSRAKDQYLSRKQQASKAEVSLGKANAEINALRAENEGLQARIVELEQENREAFSELTSIRLANQYQSVPDPAPPFSPMGSSTMEIDDGAPSINYTSTAAQSAFALATASAPPSGVTPNSKPLSSKCKASLEDRAERKRSAAEARRWLIDLRTNLPLPLGTTGDPHLADRAWSHVVDGFQGRTLFAQLQAASTSRYCPEWKAAVDEVRRLQLTSPKLVGPAQAYMLRLNRLLLTIRKEAMNNRAAVPPNVCWEADGFPNQEDLQVWQFCWTVINRT